MAEIENVRSADTQGRINLGKAAAGQHFRIIEDNDRLILEPVEFLSKREYERTQSTSSPLYLSDKEWENFEKILEADDEPNENLQKLMQKK
ncbi:MAG: hypothetical protein CMO81_05345 [Waddliaceae bacterium]|nr:hypothetical protein [Waddliaceae bacterium]